LKDFRVDLHVHTVLSPCAEIEMLPLLIVEEANRRGIQVIAITDHNATANIQAVMLAAAGTGLTVLPGMELQTREEVHVLALFQNLEDVTRLQTIVDERLPHLKNDPEHFGVQLVVDQAGEILSQEDRLLITSANISIEEAVNLIRLNHGLAIPAHVNRKGYGLIQTLGFVPEEVNVPALEISRHIQPSQAYQIYPQIRKYPLIQNGDVHCLDDFLGATIFSVETPSLREMELALAGLEGRSFRVNPL
jgi:PHP family Zn ribbon phosphoesterase